MKPTALPPTPGWKAESAETFRLAVPLVLANLLQMLTYAVDVIFIARLGAEELAASSLAVAIIGFLLWSLSGLTGAVAPMAAAELGARGPALRPIRRAVRMALWLAIASGAVASVLCAFAEPFMLMTGQEPQIAALAGSYMNLLLFSLIPAVAGSVLRNFVATLGRPFFATAITGLGIFINAAANYAFIFGNWGAPEMGLQGAAIATLLTTSLTFLVYVIAIARDPRLARYHVFGFFWRADWKRLGELMRIGTPIMLTIMAESGIFAAAAFLVGLFGAAQLAAHALALQIAALAFQVPFGIGQAATIRVGYFHGARDAIGVGRAGWTSIGMCLAFAVPSALVLIGAPELLLRIYIDPDLPENAALVAQASIFLVVASAFQLSDGLQAVAAGALRGLKDTRVPMWIAIFSYWVPGFGLAMGLAFTLGLEGEGVWYGLALGLSVAAVLLLWRWHRRGALGLVTYAPPQI